MKKQTGISDKQNYHSSDNRRDFLKKATIGGLGTGLLGVNNSAELIAAPYTVQNIES